VADDAGRDLAGVLAELDDDLGEAPGPVERAHEA
jgi:hypothetical protein